MKITLYTLVRLKRLSGFIFHQKYSNHIQLKAYDVCIFEFLGSFMTLKEKLDFKQNLPDGIETYFTNNRIIKI